MRPKPEARKPRADDKETLLTPRDLADRWQMSENTLERWRWSARGPRWVKLGGFVRYRLSDVLTFEKERRK
jgi:predicted DNA-binding transcriptional regulator AlpA